MPANSFAAIRTLGRHDVCAPARHTVRANHAGEFIRRYSPCKDATTYALRRDTP